MTDRFLIIGQGILGACVAYELSQRQPNADITVIAAHPLNSGATATGASWGWVNAHTDNDQYYFDFRNASRMLWHDLLADHPDLAAQILPSLVYDLDPEALDAAFLHHRNWGYPVNLLSHNEIQQVTPIFRNAPPKALLTQGELGVEQHIVAEQLLAKSNATCRTAYVHSMILKEGTVTGAMTDQGAVYADKVILAAGHGIPPLLRRLGIHFQLAKSTGLLVRSTPMAPFLDHMIMGHEFHIRQSADGSVLIGGAFDADHGDADLDQAVENLCNLVRLNFDLPSDLEVHKYSLGTRVLPMDGRPKIGFVAPYDTLYALAMHGGVTNAPMAAKTCVDDLLGEPRDTRSLTYDFTSSPLSFDPINKDSSDV